MPRTITALLLFAALSLPAAAQSSSDFHWSGVVAPGKTFEIKGVNGSVRAELASDNQVEVTAMKRSKHSEPSSVSIQTIQEDGNVTICAVYPSEIRPRGRSWRAGDYRPNECGIGDVGHLGSHDNDVVVDFVVRVPAGVRFVGKTVNGSVDARGLKSDADVRTVNGRIDLATTGIGAAETVNGAIEASVGSANWSGRLEFNTVNGSITLRLPKDASTNLRARMMNGGFESEFPVTVQSLGRRNHRVDGVIGKGGRDLDIETVNGSIYLRFVPN